MERRLTQFNMTLASLPKPSTADLGDSDDSEEDDGDGDGDRGAGGGGSGRGSGRPGISRGGRPGSRRKRGVPIKCPFDREEILQIWAR